MTYTGFNIQLKTVPKVSKNYVVITDQDPSIHYYEAISSIGFSTSTYFTITLDAAPTENLYTNCNIVVLSGKARGNCYHIITSSNNTSCVITLSSIYGDLRTTGSGTEQILANGDYVAVVYTAETMYSYCTTNGYDCVSLYSEKISKKVGSPSEPKSLPAHYTTRINIGKYFQGVVLDDIEFWDSSPYKRTNLVNRFEELLFSWHEISNQNPVYLIITVEDYVNSQIVYTNMNFRNKHTSGTKIYGRGYLSGYPMSNDGTWELGYTSSIPFKESWKT